MEASPHPSFSLLSTLSLPLPAKPGGCPSRVLYAPVEPRQPGTTLQGQVEKEALGGGEGILQGTPNLTQPTTSCKCWGDGAGVSAVWRHPAGPEREGGLGSGLHGAWHCGLHSGRWHREEPPRLGRQLCEEVGREAAILVRGLRAVLVYHCGQTVPDDGHVLSRTLGPASTSTTRTPTPSLGTHR